MKRSIFLAAVLGWIAVLVALAIDPRALLMSYLAAVVTITAISVGALAVLMVTYLVRGNWTDGLHLPLTAAALTTPIAGMLFVAVLVGIPWLYTWAEPGGGTGFKAFSTSPSGQCSRYGFATAGPSPAA